MSSNTAAVKAQLGEFINLYLAKRILYSLFTLWMIATLVFMMTTVLPGSAAHMILGQSATEERVAVVEEELGLNEPIHVRYMDWLSGVVTGDWGQSFMYKTSVLGVIWPRLLRTAQLAVFATLFVIAVSIPVGVIAAAKHEEALDNALSGVSYIAVSIPEFVSGTLLLLLLAGPPLNLFPTGGYTAPGENIANWLSHLVLPSLTLAFLLLAHVMRQTRAAVIDALQSEYVRAARVKGLPEWIVLFKHALRNGLLPTITVIALNFGWMMGSLVVVEEVFNYPGLGQLIVQAIHNRDVPLIQMAILIPTGSYVFANLGADILYAYLDSRIEFGKGS
jgi:peptide/nickel transport system permease protein